MSQQQIDTPNRDSFYDGQPDFLLSEKESHEAELGPFVFGQF